MKEIPVIHKSILLILVLASISVAVFAWSNKLNHTSILGDELPELLRANNQTTVLNSGLAYLDNKSYELSSILSITSPNEEPFFDKASFYISNWHKLSNQAPVYGLITKLPLIGAYKSVFNLRLLSSFFIILSLLAFIIFQKVLGINKWTILISSGIYLSLSQLISVATFSKPYAFLLFLYIVTLTFYILFLQSKRYRLLFAIFTILFFNISFLSYFLTAAYYLVAFTLIAVYFILTNKESKIIHSLSMLLIFVVNHILYLPVILKSQLLYSNVMADDRHGLLSEGLRLIKKLIYFLGLNYKGFVAIPLCICILLLLILAIKSSSDKGESKKTLFLSLILLISPFVATVAIDIALGKYLVATQRYFYISLPFIAFFLALLLSAYKNKSIYLCMIIFSFLIVNNIDTSLQKYTKSSPGFSKVIREAKLLGKEVSQDSQTPTLIITTDYQGYFIIFLRYFYAQLHGLNPLSYVYKAESDMRSTKNIFCANQKMSLGEVKELIHEQGIKKVYFYNFSRKVIKKRNFTYREVKKMVDESFPDLSLNKIKIKELVY